MRSRERRRWQIGRVSGVALAVSGLAAWGLFACAPKRPPEAADGEWVTSSSPAPPPIAAARTATRWDLADQLRAVRPTGKRAWSEHLGGELEGEVLAAPGTSYPPRGPESHAPAGTTLIERLFRAGTPEPLTYLVMIKRTPGYDPPGGDWEYLVVSPDGRVVEPSPLPLCARCHAEAPHDHLFGGGR